MKAILLTVAVCVLAVMSLSYYALDAFTDLENAQSRRLDSVQRALSQDQDAANDRAMIARNLELQRMRKAIAQGRKP